MKRFPLSPLSLQIGRILICSLLLGSVLPSPANPTPHESKHVQALREVAKKLRQKGQEAEAKSIEDHLLKLSQLGTVEKLSKQITDLRDQIEVLESAIGVSATITVVPPTIARPQTTNQTPGIKRSASTPANLIDLSQWYNADLKNDWHKSKGNNFASLPTGVQTFAGTQFDVRGLIQLRATNPGSKSYPKEVRGIVVDQHCEKLHFLHNTLFARLRQRGNTIAAYVINHEDGESTTVPLHTGKNLLDWCVTPHTLSNDGDAVLAWTGTNERGRPKKTKIHLNKFTWVNPRPTVKVKSIDFLGDVHTSGPFLIALTADPASGKLPQGSPPLSKQSKPSASPFQQAIKEMDRHAQKQEWFSAYASIAPYLKEIDQGYKLDRAFMQKVGALIIATGKKDQHIAVCNSRVASLLKSSPTEQLEHAARICFLAPNYVPKALRAKAIEWARWGVERKDTKPRKLQPWFHLALGMGEYRAGNYDAAATSLDLARKSKDPACKGTALAFQSMVAHQQSRHGKASKLLGKAQALLANNSASYDGTRFWYDGLSLQLAVSNAETLISEKESNSKRSGSTN